MVFLAFFYYSSNQRSDEYRQKLYDEIFVSTSLISTPIGTSQQAAIAEKELVLSREKLTAEQVQELLLLIRKMLTKPHSVLMKP